MKKMTSSKWLVDIYSFDLRKTCSEPLPCQCGRTPKVELIFPSDGSFYYSLKCKCSRFVIKANQEEAVKAWNLYCGSVIHAIQ